MLARFNMVAELDQQLRNRSCRRSSERKNVTTAFDPSYSGDGTLRPVGSPVRSAATRMKGLARHQEFGNARDRLADPARLI
jgi:hypothetical protein